MLGLRGSRKGQSTLEYAVLISVVVAALLAINAYMKRGFQGKLRDATDQIGEQFSAQTSTWDYTTQSHSKTKETLGVEGVGITRSELLDEQYQGREGKEELGKLEEEVWPK